MESAAGALDDIRKGGANLIAVARQRGNEALEELARGDFSAALSAASQCAEKLTHLYQAQSSLGGLATGTIVSVGSVEIGMKLCDLNGIPVEIEDIVPCPCEQEGCSKKVLKIAGEEVGPFLPTEELVIVID